MTGSILQPGGGRWSLRQQDTSQPAWAARHPLVLEPAGLKAQLAPGASGPRVIVCRCAGRGSPTRFYKAAHLPLSESPPLLLLVALQALHGRRAALLLVAVDARPGRAPGIVERGLEARLHGRGRRHRVTVAAGLLLRGQRLCGRLGWWQVVQAMFNLPACFSWSKVTAPSFAGSVTLPGGRCGAGAPGRRAASRRLLRLRSGRAEVAAAGGRRGRRLRLRGLRRHGRSRRRRGGRPRSGRDGGRRRPRPAAAWSWSSPPGARPPPQPRRRHAGRG